MKDSGTRNEEGYQAVQIPLWCYPAFFILCLAVLFFNKWVEPVMAYATALF